MPDDDRRTVVVLRHCVRSTSATVTHAIAGYTAPSDYSSLSAPAWGVAPKMCTPAGLEIMEGTGADLRQRFVSDTASLAVVADPVARDVESAQAILRGMGRNESVTLSLSADTFDTLDPEVGSARCSARYTDADIAATVRERLATVPQPSART